MLPIEIKLYWSQRSPLKHQLPFGKSLFQTSWKITKLLFGELVANSYQLLTNLSNCLYEFRQICHQFTKTYFFSKLNLWSHCCLIVLLIWNVLLKPFPTKFWLFPIQVDRNYTRMTPYLGNNCLRVLTKWQPMELTLSWRDFAVTASYVEHLTYGTVSSMKPIQGPSQQLLVMRNRAAHATV